jgi:hypothetical protein
MYRAIQEIACLTSIKDFVVKSDTHIRGGNFCGHLGFEILRNFAEILQAKICGQPKITKKIAVPTSKKNYKSKKKAKFSLHKSYIFELTKDADHFDDTSKKTF